MYLSDVDVRKAMQTGDLTIQSTDPDHPFEPDKQIRFASIDIRVGNQFMRYKPNVDRVDVVEDADRIEELFERLPDAKPGDAVTLAPGEVLLGQTLERIILSNAVAARLVPRTSFARLGVSVHCSNDFINPGQHGVCTLQLVNHNRFPVLIRPYMSICQLIVVRLTTAASAGYRDRVDVDSRYPFESQATPSRIALDEEIQRILQSSGIRTADPSARAALAQKVQSQRQRQTEDLVSFVRTHARSPADAAEIQRVLDKYEDTQSSAGRRLVQISWLASSIFLGTLVWLLTHLSPVLSGKAGTETLYIPGMACGLSLVFTLIARTWRQ